MIFFFAKYQGAGNDFLIFDDREETFPISDADYLRFLCDRHLGIGADGLLLLQRSQKADLRMRIFNSDGREASMCGNGLRCLVDFAYQLELIGSHSVIEIADREVHCLWEEGGITVDLGAHEWIHSNLSIDCFGIDVIHIGVQHAVVFVENHDLFLSHAPYLRNHPLMGMEGANVNFAVLKEGVLYTRTFERGVEAETLACGSGAAAVAIAASHRHQLKNPITIIPRSQEPLKVEVLPSTVRLSGKATFVFHGSIGYEGVAIFRKVGHA